MKISDFSKLTNIPIKTLRYYNDIGLLNPVSVDTETGYREYGVEHLAEINHILALKDAGFTLKEIAGLGKLVLSKEKLLNILQEKLVVAQEEHFLTQIRIANLQARIKHTNFEEDYSMADITVKKIAPILVASIREKNISEDEFSGFFGIISDDAKANDVKETGPWICIRHDDNGDWEACAQIEKEYTSNNPKIKVYYLPTVTKMACIVHKGGWGIQMKPTIDDFFEWVKLNGVQITHPYREIFHYGERENPDWSTFITEMQYPLM